MPESFKVLIKELQSLALDIRVLRDDNTEVEITENVDYGSTDFNSIMNDDRQRYETRRDFEARGFSTQEFVDGELQEVEEETEDDYDSYTDDSDE